MIARRNLLIAVGAGALVSPLASLAQPPAKVHRTGWMSALRRSISIAE